MVCFWGPKLKYNITTIKTSSVIKRFAKNTQRTRDSSDSEYEGEQSFRKNSNKSCDEIPGFNLLWILGNPCKSMWWPLASAPLIYFQDRSCWKQYMPSLWDLAQHWGQGQNLPGELPGSDWAWPVYPSGLHQRNIISKNWLRNCAGCLGKFKISASLQEGQDETLGRQLQPQFTGRISSSSGKAQFHC